MHVEPDVADFTRTYEAGEAQVVWTRLVADLETPVSAMLKLSAGRANCFLLESVEGGATRGRYSIIGIEPDLVFRAFGDRAEISTDPRAGRERFEPMEAPALDALRRVIGESRIRLPNGLPPMSAGIFGYLGYDMVRLMEDLPPPNPDPLGLPDAILIRPTVIVVFDAVKDEIAIVSPVRPTRGVGASQAHARAVDRLTQVVEALDAPLDSASDGGPADLDRPVTSNTPRERYLDMVRQAKDYIAAGDIFQVVLSQRFEAPFELPPFALYRALRRTNPSPYLYFLDFGDFAVAGSSPEILVRVRQGEVTIRPIAGTRPRGETPEADAALAAELLADPKERAEHLMLLDLGRNDVGRVAEIGTVKVTDRFFLEYYSHVMHIVSNVVGRLAAGSRRAGGAGRRLPRRHRLRRAEGARHGDHRRAGSGEARHLRRLRRLFHRRRRHGHLHRAPHLDRQGRQDVRPGGRRHRRRFRAGEGAGRVRGEVPRPLPRRRGSRPLRRRGRTRTVGNGRSALIAVAKASLTSQLAFTR